MATHIISNQAEKNKNFTLPRLNTFPQYDQSWKKEYYDFIGWNTDKNATTTLYQDGATVNFNSATTLYAIWRKKDNPPPVNPPDDDNVTTVDISNKKWYMTDSYYGNRFNETRPMCLVCPSERYMNHISCFSRALWGCLDSDDVPQDADSYQKWPMIDIGIEDHPDRYNLIKVQFNPFQFTNNLSTNVTFQLSGTGIPQTNSKGQKYKYTGTNTVSVNLCCKVSSYGDPYFDNILYTLTGNNDTATAAELSTMIHDQIIPQIKQANRSYPNIAPVTAIPYRLSGVPTSINNNGKFQLSVRLREEVIAIDNGITINNVYWLNYYREDSNRKVIKENPLSNNLITVTYTNTSTPPPVTEQITLTLDSNLGSLNNDNNANATIEVTLDSNKSQTTDSSQPLMTQNQIKSNGNEKPISISLKSPKRSKVKVKK